MRINSRPPELPGDKQRPSFRWEGEITGGSKRLRGGEETLASYHFGYGYDDIGNLTADARWSYTWDGERSDQCGRIVDAGVAEARRVRSTMPRRPHQNRLIGMETQASAVTAGVPKEKLVFAYDHQGRRIQKRTAPWNGIDDWDWSGGTDHLFVYDGWNPVMRLDALAGGAADQKTHKKTGYMLK